MSCHFCSWFSALILISQYGRNLDRDYWTEYWIPPLTKDRADPPHTFCFHGSQLNVPWSAIHNLVLFIIILPHKLQHTSPIPLAHDSRWTEHKWLENTHCSEFNTNKKMLLCCLKWKFISLSSACHLYHQPWKV